MKQKLSFFEKLAFGGGNLANCLVLMMISSYLMFYYTDIFKISPVAVGTLFLVARFADAIIDFSMGFIVDHTHTRWGKFRPFIIFGCVPLLCFAILCFTAPELSENGKIIYAYITYLGVMVMYSIVSIPYTSMTSSLTLDPKERVSVSTFPQFFGMFGNLIVTVITVPLVSILGNGNDKAGYQYTMIVYCIVALLLYILMVTKSKERVVIESQEQFPLKKAIPIIFKNKPLMLLVGYFIFAMASYTLRTSTQMYYYTYSLGRVDLIAIIGFVTMVPLVGIIPFIPKLTGILGKKNLLLAGTGLTAAASIIQFFVPFTNIPVIYLCSAMNGLGTGIFVTMVWGMLPDTVEYSEWKNGIRTEGVIYSSFTFAQKVSMGLSGSLAGILLSVVGYSANTVFTSSTLTGISFIYNVISGVGYIVAMIFIFMYDLTPEKYQMILTEINKRKEGVVHE